MIANMIPKKLYRYSSLTKNTLYNTAELIISKEEKIIAFWLTGVKNNWGDALNPILIQKMTGKKPILSTEVFNIKENNVYSVVGSILQALSEKNSVVWGSGFISANSQFKTEPKKICAVRGPRTRELILKQGIPCPQVYGDPAILYPYFYRSEVNKKYKLGIIPHHIDQDNELLGIFNNDSNILIIDILSGINKVVDEICSCERIASSSLHGIIVADAYGIPSIWVEFSKKVVGDGFKFYDYFESVGRYNEAPLRITKETTVNKIIDQYREYKIEIDINKLVDSCPFIDYVQKENLKYRIATQRFRA